ncbi:MULTISPECIES: hypothetical protein [Gordonia]|uniref:Uncharacterized protein n=1 Tax=Gordonia alkanivorans NBRC 16433 TaxID=1027371 RepID=F9VYF3_9ACTN|nr:MULTISPECIES: hypothetical protein [Gordonia]MDH3021485.1 hypothetical protein [Gordonia alkanivorans]MDH3025290.1 hypothetical protein [Gordonia alkanivorans]MDH3051015.1 hypothetical protein [Gordonia alkanivorans]MDJ0009038.1 hypothetical protein [Gordonia alkanivorans]MDJ0028685.1 hypothetical protein [Gordonia alkanivorans]
MTVAQNSTSLPGTNRPWTCVDAQIAGRSDVTGSPAAPGEDATTRPFPSITCTMSAP